MRHSTKTGARVTCLGEELRVRWVRLQLHGASGSWPFASGQVSSLPADFLSRLSAPSSTRISWEDSAESVWREDMAVRRERRRRRRAAERWLLFVLTLFAVDVVLGERISAAAAAFLTPFKTAGVAGGVHWGSLCQFRGRPPPEELRRVSVWRSGLTGKENTAPLAVAWSDAPFRADLTRRGRGLRLPRALFGGGASRPLPSSQLRGRSAAFSSSQSGGFGNWGGDDFGTEGFAIQVASQVPSATTSPRRPGVLARLTASACYLMPLVDVAQTVCTLPTLHGLLARLTSICSTVSFAASTLVLRKKLLPASPFVKHHFLTASLLSVASHTLTGINYKVLSYFLRNEAFTENLNFACVAASTSLIAAAAAAAVRGMPAKLPVFSEAVSLHLGPEDFETPSP